MQHRQSLFLNPYYVTSLAEVGQMIKPSRHFTITVFEQKPKRQADILISGFNNSHSYRQKSHQAVMALR